MSLSSLRCSVFVDTVSTELKCYCLCFHWQDCCRRSAAFFLWWLKEASAVRTSAASALCQILRGMLIISQIISYVSQCRSQVVSAKIPENRSGWMFCGVSIQHDAVRQNAHSPSILIESDGIVYRALNESQSSSVGHR